jgi:hypothetical protein
MGGLDPRMLLDRGTQRVTLLSAIAAQFRPTTELQYVAKYVSVLTVSQD